jgi:hypothetical protein
VLRWAACGVAVAPQARRHRCLEAGISPDEVAGRGGESSDRADERQLRAKYFDWCSARLAERFLQLSPEQIYELAARAPAGAGVAVSPLFVQNALPETGSDALRSLIERVTEVLIAEIGLPTFEQWSQAYRAEPEHFDADLLGLWRDWE